MKSIFNFIKIKYRFIIFLFLLTQLVFYSCLKYEPVSLNGNNDDDKLFTADEIKWISNETNPSYRFVNSLGLVDTITSVTKTEYYHVTGGYPDNAYYQGYFSLNISSFYPVRIDIDNKNSGFHVKLTEIFTSYFYLPDTAWIDGVYYDDVYKVFNSSPLNSQACIKIYFKKSLGFLYLEKSNGERAIKLRQ